MSGFWQGKRVLLTGHTGFKGSWLSLLLLKEGAQVTGYALPPPEGPSLFDILGLEKNMQSVTGDVRDLSAMEKAFEDAKPEIVLHLAAQPLVRESYQNPVYTYETNVMGTVNVLECLRRFGGVRSFLNVTTDKVYRNNEWAWGYRETDFLDGFDPYSNSKSCSELVTHSYALSFFKAGGAAISTARAGNVLGGGDFAMDRILPDCLRAVAQGKPILVRNPCSTRPYQHVLEPLSAYLTVTRRQWEDPSLAGSYNVGPDDSDCVTTGALVDLFVNAWGEGASWQSVAEKNAPHEANFLKLDCSKLKAAMGWRPRWRVAKAVEKTVEWAKALDAGENMRLMTLRQMDEFQMASEAILNEQAF